MGHSLGWLNWIVGKSKHNPEGNEKRPSEIREINPKVSLSLFPHGIAGMCIPFPVPPPKSHEATHCSASEGQRSCGHENLFTHSNSHPDTCVSPPGVPPLDKCFSRPSIFQLRHAVCVVPDGLVVTWYHSDNRDSDPNSLMTFQPVGR